MPRFEKWLTAATPDAPADSVARIALAERLVSVATALLHSQELDPQLWRYAEALLRWLQFLTDRRSELCDVTEELLDTYRNELVHRKRTNLGRRVFDIRVQDERG